MLKNYFRIAIRSFLKDKVNGFINLIGLAVGLCSVFMILAYVKYELSYDKQYTHSGRVYRIVSGTSNKPIASAHVLQPLAYRLKSDFPEIEAATFISGGENQFQINREPVKIKTISTDPNFLLIFNLPFISGDPATALISRNDIVITEKIARTFFPGKNPVGSNLFGKDFYQKTIFYKITGVIRDIPANIHFKGDIIVSNGAVTDALDWNGGNMSTEYLLLKQNSTAAGLEQKFPSFIKKHKCPYDFRLSLQPVQSIHLHGNLPDEPFLNSNIKYVYIFSLVALLILAIACINSINLTTARSLQRVREVGVRKVMGAERRQLATQFTAESVLVFLCALPPALFLSYFLWPLFAGAMNMPVSNEYLFHGRFIAGILLTCLLTGMLSGLYPAFFLSGLRPAHILKDWQRSFKLNLNIRKALIVFQFVASVSLIIATAIVYAQLHLLNTMELGFDKNYLVALPSEMLGNKAEVFKHELKKNRNVSDVTVSTWKAGEQYGSYSEMSSPADSTKAWKFVFIDADFDFLKTMRIGLLQGRDFSPAFAIDHFTMDSFFIHLAANKMSQEEITKMQSSLSIIVTEETAKTLQIKNPVVGSVLSLGGLQGTIIGEVKNFVGIVVSQESPMVIIKSGADLSYGYTYVRIEPYDISHTIEYIQSVWKKTFPDTQFEFSFVDQRLQQSYNAQTRLASIFNSFAVLAIIIAAMGLFSLVALTVQQKTKEIGIRKVLGASVGEIVRLLSGDFVKLIVL
ncbi:MAG TPA: FtsX-like permease family protein, partial [Puia sp.]|nr:FtsX-like permease family protein [Puia sp.]